MSVLDSSSTSRAESWLMMSTSSSTSMLTRSGLPSFSGSALSLTVSSPSAHSRLTSSLANGSSSSTSESGTTTLASTSESGTTDASGLSSGANDGVSAGESVERRCENECEGCPSSRNESIRSDSGASGRGAPPASTSASAGGEADESCRSDEKLMREVDWVGSEEGFSIERKSILADGGRGRSCARAAGGCECDARVLVVVCRA